MLLLYIIKSQFSMLPESFLFCFAVACSFLIKSIHGKFYYLRVCAYLHCSVAMDKEIGVCQTS